jgi:hypothetical protein
LLHGDVAGNCRDRRHTNVPRSQRHDDRYGIIGSGVGIDQEWSFHAA